MNTEYQVTHIDQILSSVLETFNKSAIWDLRHYLTINNHSKKFLIFSDYCIGDVNKANDAVAFTIMPYDEYIEDTKTAINELTKKDIKSKSVIEDRFLDYMKETRFFHVSYILTERKGVTQREGIEQRDVVLAMIDNTLQMLDNWIINTPSNSEYFNIVKGKLGAAKTATQRKSANFKLLRDVITISMLAGVLAFLLTREGSAEVVGWFSDRDKIIDVFDGIASDFYGLNHHSLCERGAINSGRTKIVVGIPELDANGKVWYDEMNRIPDHIAGTLADLNLNDNISTRDKFIQVKVDLLADNNFCAIFNLKIKRAEYSCGRIMMSRTHPFHRRNILMA